MPCDARKNMVRMGHNANITAAVVASSALLLSCGTVPKIQTVKASQAQPGLLAATSSYNHYEYGLPRPNCGPSAIARGPDGA